MATRKPSLRLVKPLATGADLEPALSAHRDSLYRAHNVLACALAYVRTAVDDSTAELSIGGAIECAMECVNDVVTRLELDSLLEDAKAATAVQGGAA